MDEIHTDFEGCSRGSVSGTGYRIWMRYTQTARVAAGKFVCYWIQDMNETHTDFEGYSRESVSGTGYRIWMRHTQTARVVAGKLCLVLDTEYG
jgi:hypothetical protein